MKIKKTLKMLIVLNLLFSTYLICQQSQPTSVQADASKENVPDTIHTRKIFIYSSLGISEFLSLGVGYQVSHDFAISMKASATFIGSGWLFPNNGYGLGIKLSYFYPFSIFNCVNAEYISYLALSYPKGLNSITKGNFIEINIGKEVIAKKGLRIFWSLGYSFNYAKESEAVWSPSIKIGMNYNIF